MKSYVIPSNGGDAISGTLLIKDNVWTFPWEDKDAAGKTYYFQLVNLWTHDVLESRGFAH